MAIERIIFIHDYEEAGSEALRILDDDGEEAAIRYLSQWHYPGEHEIADALAAGTSDDAYHDSNGYVLTYNRGLGYIELEFVEA